MTVLAVYPWPAFWSMGEGRGAAAFFLSVTSFPAHGHEMHVLMPGASGSPREEDYHGATLHRFRTSIEFMPETGRSRAVQHLRLLASYLYWFIRALPAGLSLAARIRPDVIIGMGELGAPVAFVLARLRGVPNVTRLFGVSLNEVVGSRLRFMLRYREVNALRTPADFLVVCDDGSAGDEIARRLGVDMEKFLFWSDGVDKARYAASDNGASARERLGIPEERLVVLSVSRLHREKHVDRLLLAAPEVLAERDDVTFVIVGDGEERGNLHDLTKALGIEDRVVFTGALDVGEIPGIYRASDLFVTLSDRTNVCNPLHEAMMSGLPVIALDTGRTGEFIEDGVTGILLATEALRELPGLILNVLADEGRRGSLAGAARASADAKLPTIEQRQAMEVKIAERAVEEHARRRRA